MNELPESVERHLNASAASDPREEPASPPASGSAWTEGDTPSIPHGTTRLFWVTMRSKESGKTWVKPMRFMNGHVMPLADSCDDPGPHAVPHDPESDGYCEEYEWTGWSEGHCEYCDSEWMWSSHYVEIIAHAPMNAPEPFEPNDQEEARRK